MAPSVHGDAAAGDSLVDEGGAVNTQDLISRREKSYRLMRSLKAAADDAVFFVERLMVINMELRAKIEMRDLMIDLMIDRLFEQNSSLENSNRYLTDLARSTTNEPLLTVGFHRRLNEAQAPKQFAAR